MKVRHHSYRFSTEILQHPNYRTAWDEVYKVLKEAPLFVYPNKSAKNKRLNVVQQVMNVYFDRRLSVDLGWIYHPLATRIENSGLAADFRKTFHAPMGPADPLTGEMLPLFPNMTIQAEVQFGNMSRWYSDIFKFQTAYSQSLIDVGLCIVPMASLARRIDSNVTNYERTLRELPSANLSITLPIVLFGLEPDEHTQVIDISKCQFANIQSIIGKGGVANRWRIVNGYIDGTLMADIGPDSPTGPLIEASLVAEDEPDA